MKKHTKATKTLQRSGMMAITARALVCVIGGDDGVIHAEVTVGGGHLPLDNGVIHLE